MALTSDELFGEDAAVGVREWYRELRDEEYISTPEALILAPWAALFSWWTLRHLKKEDAAMERHGYAPNFRQGRTITDFEANNPDPATWMDDGEVAAFESEPTVEIRTASRTWEASPEELAELAEVLNEVTFVDDE